MSDKNERITIEDYVRVLEYGIEQQRITVDLLTQIGRHKDKEIVRLKAEKQLIVKALDRDRKN